ncbi:hypothetical protein B7463_g7514, partial [Scytalidium lignicola]
MDLSDKNERTMSPEDPQDVSPTTQRGHKRKRLSHAYRCDGGNPCSPCVTDYLQCSYGFAIPSQGKSDTILKMVIQNNELVQKVLDEIQTYKSNDIIRDSRQLETGSQSLALKSGLPAAHDEINNATIPSRHRSGAYFMLQWPIFDDCEGLRQNIKNTVVLEAGRAPIEFSPLIRYPYVTADEVDRIINTFQQNVNFWMPTISLDQIQKVRQIVLTGQNDLTSDVCLAMLIMALGLACEFVEQKLHHDSKMESVAYRHLQMSSLYFEASSRASAVAQMEMTPVSAHCSLLTVLSPLSTFSG